MKTLLSSSVSVAKYKKMESNRDAHAIANFVKERFMERYITPMRVDPKKKNGFTTMAVSCLLIEALESFYRGRADSNGKSQRAFCNFFDRNKGFRSFHGLGQSFYKNVRCGILHQGETTGGWHIRRDGVIFNKKAKTINAKLFHDEIEIVLKNYCEELRGSAWSAPISKSFNANLPMAQAGG